MFIDLILSSQVLSLLHWISVIVFSVMFLFIAGLAVIGAGDLLWRAVSSLKQ